MRLLFILMAVVLLGLLVMPLKAQNATTYVVQPGDTLYRIALRFGVAVAALQQANNITNPGLIFVGQVLVIPGGSNTASASPTFNLTPAADNRPPTSGDGRINLVPWVNSFGAIAVYCVDRFDHPGGYYNGGGIRVLNVTGQRLFFAPERLIVPARTQADASHVPVLILSGPIYALYALPDDYFQLNSIPDAEGKVFLGMWKECIPVSAPAAPFSTPTPTPTPKPTID